MTLTAEINLGYDVDLLFSFLYKPLPKSTNKKSSDASTDTVMAVNLWSSWERGDRGKLPPLSSMKTLKSLV